jgi:hypothetical protein
MEQPERRERLLNTVLNVHVPPVAFVRTEAAGVAPRFASEAKEETAPATFKSVEPRVSPAVVYAAASPQIEVSARPDLDAGAVYGPEVVSLEIEEPGDLEYAHVEEQPVMVVSSRDQRVFSGKLDSDEAQSNTEDLDVPAFMRRGGL